jgi:hypothetical protein
MKRPWQLLPIKEPKEFNPGSKFFYEKVAEPLIKDTIRIMSNGIPINLDKVDKLEKELDAILEKIALKIKNNKYIKAFQKEQAITIKAELTCKYKSKMREYTHYLKPYDEKNMVHRSYCIKELIGTIETGDYVGKDVPKWSVKDIKKYSTIDSKILQYTSNKEAQAMAMVELAKEKARLYNLSYYGRIESISDEEIYPEFNIGSSTQKEKLFYHYLGIESPEYGDAYKEYMKVETKYLNENRNPPPYKGNKYSWGKPIIEELINTTDDEDLIEIYKCILDYSAGNIIKTTFIPAFQNNTIDGFLYGSYSLLGAKSGRYTSQQPNLQNFPSTGSVYAKPIKECFEAPEGYVIYTIDYSALEDRVIASISKDKNKCNVFLENLDGHCLNAYGYFKDEISQYMELTNDTNRDVKEFYILVEEGHKELKAIRQKGKPATFGISYGAYPPKIAKTLKVSLDEATKLFNNYHNVLYPGITEYREKYVLPTTNENGYVHLGLGFSIDSDDVQRNARTLVNATIQFWSMLTYITTNELHYRIDRDGYSNDIYQNATIYDSIYMIVKKDANTIKWLNDNVVEIMTKDFIENQIVSNEAVGEIGRNWANLEQVPNKATIEEIEQILKGV